MGKIVFVTIFTLIFGVALSAEGDIGSMTRGDSMMGNFSDSPMGWIGLGFGWIFMILFWVLIIAGIVALIRWLIVQLKEGGSNKEKTAMDILNERYARGEINKNEYAERKKDLS